MSLVHDLHDAMERAVEEGHTPGAVALVGCEGRVFAHLAVGRRMATPESRPMEPETVFDMASITKPVATATCILHLLERGRLCLGDPVNRYLKFEGDGRERATLFHLLTHSSGIPPYVNYLQILGEGVPPQERRARVVEETGRLALQWAPGEGFAYSCLGYILLTSIVEKVSGRTLDAYAAEHIFGPLGMTETRFCPPPDVAARCAATEVLPEGVLCGVVHDENARYLGGVGGNAGLFSTAADLARYARALLAMARGKRDEGVPRFPLSACGVRLMTTAQSKIPGGERSLGWDVDSGYTPQVRGDLFGPGGVGHTGFTGTSMWLDPASGGYCILLTNRVHFGRDKEVSRLRRQVANIAAAMMG
jgi:CubicO group peptidase (beta-lactamase class C family)